MTHFRPSRAVQASPGNTRKQTHIGIGLLVLTIWIALGFSMTPSVLASTIQKHPRKLTAAQIQELERHLHQQIHITHTGKKTGPTSTLRPQTTGLPAYNNIGISNPATGANANFDAAGRSYSAQALQDVGLYPGISITSQNITFLWPAVTTGVADNYQAAGQVIAVTTTPGAATLGFLGASTNGNTSGMATLTYTDGTSTTFTLGLTDWWNGTAAFSNQAVVSMTTIDTKHGTKTGNFYLYSAVTTLNTSKTLQSVTLPTTVSPGQLHIFAVAVGGPAYNNTGISDDSSPASASFDNGTADDSYSAEALQGVHLVSHQLFDLDGIAYTWPAASSGTADNYQASGQVLPIVPVPNATTLGFLGASANGNSSGTATMTFTDGTTQTFTLGLTDWGTSTVAFGNLVAATMSYRNHTGGMQNIPIFVYAVETAIPAGKTLQSVTLPSTLTGGQLHIFSIGTRSTFTNLGTSNDSQPGAGNMDNTHHSYSLQALEAAGITPGQPFPYDGTSFTLPASYGSLADNDEVNGLTQTLTVTPVANATMLIVLGASDFANASGTATITYTNGSTQTFTLSLSDWLLGSNTQSVAFGNDIVATMAYANQSSGTLNDKAYLFSTEIALQAGLTAQSLTLPTSITPSNAMMHIFAVGTRSQYNNTGISDDSNPAGANFDGAGNSYSEEDFTNPTVAGWNPGDTLTYEGINYIWPGVPANQADNYQAAGQVIPVTGVTGATTIGFVGSASNGGTTGSSGTATLTYTDGSTSTFTLGLTDWALNGGGGTPLAGNRLFALLPTQNTSQGSQTLSTYLFEMETPITAGKTLQSVTLPSSVNQGQIHVFMIGTRAGNTFPNNIGTSDDADSLFANFDGGGNSYSIEALESAGLNEGQTFAFNGATFNWPASYSVIPDNYQAAGQILPITPISGATTLAFLGSSANTTGGISGGNNSGTATITYTDASTQTFTLTMADWASTTAPASDQIAATCSYRNTSSGQQTLTVHVYYTDVALQTGKTIQSVTLPTTISSGQMHIFAVSTK